MAAAVLVFFCLAAAEPYAPAEQNSPTGQVRGVALARGTRDPIPGATITVDTTPAGETGTDGRFDLRVAPGPHRLSVQAPGFDLVDAAIKVAAGAAVDLTLRLPPRQTGERYETVVTPAGERAGKVSLGEDELLRTPGSMGDPFRVMQSLPGVAEVAWPLPIFAVRGANPGNTGFFLDGVRLPALFHFALGPSVIHPYFLERIDFYPGGYPVRFGRFASGVVTAETKTPETDRARASVDVRLLDAGGIVVTPFHSGAGTVAVAGRYSYTGLLVSLVSPDYKLSYWDYQARVQHRARGGRATVFIFGSGDSLGINDAQAAAGTPNSRADIGFHRLVLRWEGPAWGGRVDASALLGRDASSTSLRQLVTLPISVTTHTAAPRVAFSRALASWADFEIGADSEFQRFYPHTQLADVIVKQDVFKRRNAIMAGAFAGLTLRTPVRFSVSPGFRTDAFFEQGAHKVEAGPRLNARFRPSTAKDVWLKASAGRFAQMASLPISIPGFEGFGLSNLGTQTSLQGSFGAEAKLGEALSLDTNAFYQRLRLSDLKSMFNFDPQEEILELRDGRSYGAEILLRRPAHHRLSGWLAYTLSWSERVIGQYRARAASDWDQRHIVNLVAAWRLHGGYSVGARIHYNSGRPYPIYDDRSARVDYQRLPAFYQLDLRADRRLIFDHYVMDVYVEFINSTLTREVFDLRRINGVVEERGVRVPLPSVGVHAAW